MCRHHVDQPVSACRDFTKNVNLPRVIPAEPPSSGPPSSSATVLVVDHAAAFRDILYRALKGHGEYQLIHARTVAEVHGLIAGGTAGELAVVDVRLDHSEAPDVIRTLRGAGWARVMAMTPVPIPVAPVIAAVAAGASGIVSMHPPAEPPERRIALTTRELQIVSLVADGRSNRTIAEDLSLSATTVKNHLARIGRKLGAADRAHIVAIACRGGAIPGLPGIREG